MEERIKKHLQTQYNFTSLEAGKIIYGFQVLLYELSKLLILILISILFHRTIEVFIITVVLMSIRSYCGGLHFSHYISCFVFTAGFYIAVIALSSYSLPENAIALGLVVSLAIFTLVGPITSVMRPRLKPADVQRYTRRVTYILLGYSALILVFETLPYRNIIFWVIVLQILQLLCARMTQKGEYYEKVI